MSSALGTRAIAVAELELRQPAEPLTCEPADMRNPQEALGLALDAAAATDHKDADILDTLALGYTMTGRHEDAVQINRTALALRASGPTSIMSDTTLIPLHPDLRRFRRINRRRRIV